MESGSDESTMTSGRTLEPVGPMAVNTQPHLVPMPETAPKTPTGLATIELV